MIHPHPRTRIVMTDNLRGLTEDYGSRYVGRFSQDPAVLDRFWKMRMDYMGEEANDNVPVFLQQSSFACGTAL